MNARRAVFLKIVLPQALLIVCLGLFTGTALGAGAQSAPAIDISNAQVYVTNGVPTCCILEEDDMVELAVSGAHDYDCPQGNPGDRIDLSKTRWCETDPLKGILDYQTGSTNKWIALAPGTTTVEVFFNDKDDGPEYDDDESSPKSIQVTGFRVGCHLTTNKSGSYIVYNVGPEVGDPDQGLVGESAISGGGNTDGQHGEYDECACAEWKVVVDPPGTPMKGNVRIAGRAVGTDGVAEVEVQDTDSVDGGEYSISIGLSYTASIGYSENGWGGDTCVANGGAVVAFQSDDSWLDVTEVHVNRTSNDGCTRIEDDFSYADTAYLTGNEGDKKRSDFKVSIGYEIRDEDENDSCYADCFAGVAWGFYIPEDPVYITAP